VTVGPAAGSRSLKLNIRSLAPGAEYAPQPPEAQYTPVKLIIVRIPRIVGSPGIKGASWIKGAPRIEGTSWV